MGLQMLHSALTLNFSKLRLTSLAVIACLSFTAAPAFSQETEDNTVSPSYEHYDPYENYNRAIFSFNSAFDNVVIYPILSGYRTIVPSPARTGIRNFIRHLGSPIRFANQMLQGDLGGAHDELVRAIVNTFIGFGLFDVAGYEGLEYEPEDFGQTLAVWGVGHGPYVVVPFLGPSSLRDYAGYGVDSFADPLRIYWHNIGEEHLAYTKSAASYLNIRDELKDTMQSLESSSLDYYAAVRSTYYQNRDAMVRDQDPSALSSSDSAFPDFDDEY